MIRETKIDLQFNSYRAAPISPTQMVAEATRHDEVTVNYWRDTWIKRIKENRELFGPFKEHSVGELFGKYRRQPAIIAGAGPSLKHNISLLKDTKGIPIVSCLHNFHFFEDNGVKVDFYVTVDSGDVTLEEMAEGGGKTLEEYLEISKDRTLLAFIGASTKLLQAWRGKILFFNCPLPSLELAQIIDSIEKFWLFVPVGGNVLGGCFYLTKFILGANAIIFVGADFAFDYGSYHFHSWNSKYDGKLGEVMRVTDVFGNKVSTWQSYWGFKCYFDQLFVRFPGVYVNATEGGILGAYEGGNIPQCHQMFLKDAIAMYANGDSENGFKAIEEACRNPDGSSERWVMY